MFVCFGVSVRIGNSLEQHRQVIGGFYSACKIKKSRATGNHGRMKLIHGRYLYAIKVKTLIVLMSWEFKTKYDKIDYRQVSIAMFVVTVAILGVIKLASFGFINMMLLTM